MEKAMPISDPEPLGAEHRAYQRFRIQLPCFLVTKREIKLIGRTLNISRCGVMILWEQYASSAEIPQPGSSLCVELELPRSGGSVRYLRCGGTVVRVLNTQYQTPQVALAIAHLWVRGAARKPVRRVQDPRSGIETLVM